MHRNRNGTMQGQGIAEVGRCGGVMCDVHVVLCQVSSRRHSYPRPPPRPRDKRRFLSKAPNDFCIELGGDYVAGVSGDGPENAGFVIVFKEGVGLIGVFL